MGLLRYYLAAIVVFCHIPLTQVARPFAGNGGLAVQAFYVISGFYMSLIVDKYELHSLNWRHIRNFYMSRFLRIYSLYLIALLITVIFYNMGIIKLTYSPVNFISGDVNFISKLVYIFTNLFIFGLDGMWFFIYSPSAHSFVFCPFIAYVVNELTGSNYALLGQAWSLSIELCFYLLVPFILTKPRKTILLICLLSWGLRITLLLTGIDNPSAQKGCMEFAFFPTALGVFLLGSLMHQYVLPLLTKSAFRIRRLLALFSVATIVLYSLVIYDRIPYFYFKYYLFIVLIALSTPCLFSYFKHSKIDQYIGELSYPVYLVHFLCIAMGLRFIESRYCIPAISRLIDMNYFGYYIIIISSIVSILLIHFVVKPIDNYRYKRLRRQSDLFSGLVTA